MNELTTLPLWIITVLFTGTGILVALLSFYIFRLIFPNGIISGESIRPASAVGTVIGSLFALLLALILVTVWQNFEKQKERTTTEAVILANIYRDSRGIGPEYGKVIQSHVIGYTRNLVETGWKAMERGGESKEAFISMTRLYISIIKYEPVNEKEEVLYKRMVENLNELANYRRIRLLSINQNNVPVALWVIIVVVGIISVCFTNLFVIGSKLAQASIVSVHAGIISIILMLVFLLNQPYRGATKIQPYPFEHLIENVFPAVDTL